MADNLADSLKAKVEAAAAAQRQLAVADLHELLSRERYEAPQPGDEDRLADALKVLGIGLGDLERYVAFVRQWETDIVAAREVDKLASEHKGRSAAHRDWGIERERLLREIQQKSDAFAAEVHRGLVRLGIARKAATDAARADRDWARFADGGDLFNAPRLGRAAAAE